MKDFDPAEVDLTKEVDFSIVKEDWTRYKLSDGAVLRVRILNVKVIRVGMSELGTPVFGGASQNLLSAIVPKGLINKQGTRLQGPDVTADQRGHRSGFRAYW